MRVRSPRSDVGRLGLFALFAVAGALLSASSASAQRCPAGLDCWLDQPYKEVGAVTLTADVYRQRGATGRPAVLVIHGGGWFIGDKRWETPSALLLVRAGFVAVNVNYRLAKCLPGAICPFSLTGTAGAGDQYRDVRDAMLWFRRVGQVYGADGRNVGAFGTSAGGHLTGLLTYRGSSGHTRADAGVTWGAPLMLDLRYIHLSKTTLLPADVTQNAANMIGCAWGSSVPCSNRWIRQSVTRYIGRRDPSIRIVHARDDPEARNEENPRLVSGLLMAKGIPHELRIYQPGESCSDGTSPVPSGGCRGSARDCALEHTGLTSCRDPQTGLTEGGSLTRFLQRELR
jgi:acetyl esterase/lipase